MSSNHYNFHNLSSTCSIRYIILTFRHIQYIFLIQYGTWDLVSNKLKLQLIQITFPNIFTDINVFPLFRHTHVPGGTSAGSILISACECPHKNSAYNLCARVNIRTRRKVHNEIKGKTFTRIQRNMTPRRTSALAYFYQSVYDIVWSGTCLGYTRWTNKHSLDGVKTWYQISFCCMKNYVKLKFWYQLLCLTAHNWQKMLNVYSLHVPAMTFIG